MKQFTAVVLVAVLVVVLVLLLAEPVEDHDLFETDPVVLDEDDL